MRKLTHLLKLITVATSLSLSLNLSAHDEPIESGWCANGDITILGNFNFNQTLLSKFKEENNPVCNQLKSCGQFDDDDYSIAFRVASSLCHSFSEAELAYKTTSDHQTVRPIFHAPATMKNTESNHHLLYNISQGLVFSCGYCSLDNIEHSTEKAPEKR